MVYPRSLEIKRSEGNRPLANLLFLLGVRL